MSRARNINKLSTRFFHGNYFGTTLPGGARHTTEHLRDYSIQSEDIRRVSVYFDNIEDVFVRLAQKHDVIVGAVAWLTNTRILHALANAKQAGIVVQKEDFLRRDVGAPAFPQWKQNLHALYSKLTPFDFDFSCEFYPGIQEDNPDYNSAVQHWLFDASGLYQRSGAAIRCLGYARENSQEIPRMHHKFLVFGELSDGIIMKPKCVASGSFNLTLNATRSRENLIVIEDENVCHAYLSEWAQLWCLSESLNWNSSEPVVEHMDMST